MALHLEIVTPHGSVVATDVDDVTLPGHLGEFGVLEHHVPMLALLKPGLVTYTEAGRTSHLVVSRGFAEVGHAERVLVLTDDHALPAEVDVEAATAELAAAEEKLAAWDGPITVEHREIEQEASWARACLDAAKSAEPSAP